MCLPDKLAATHECVCRVEAKRAEVAAALEAVEQSHALAARKEQAVQERAAAANEAKSQLTQTKEMVNQNAARHHDKSAEAKNKEAGE